MYAIGYIIGLMHEKILPKLSEGIAFCDKTSRKKALGRFAVQDARSKFSQIAESVKREVCLSIKTTPFDVGEWEV
ncbi:MAG: hypothetical protein Q4A39_00565 [Eubacteriales bacterium]|nr:hypothetical protein [Eubacteriales bacterium]